MCSPKTILLFLLCVSGRQLTKAQSISATKSTLNNSDSNRQVPMHLLRPVYKSPFPYRALIIPGALIAYGVTSIENNELKAINSEVKEELYTEQPHKKFPLDNYLQFAPAVAVYGLNLAGIKGRHNFTDRSMLYLLSNVIVNTAVFSVKKIAHQSRPDGSNYASFPSGHTAEAFASAEFLRQEYKSVSPWYGIAGYAVAATTGYLRMYNNKHWLNDVAAGAGMGILSTRIAYWLYPKIKQRLTGKRYDNTMLLPSYRQGSFGISMLHRF